MQYDICLKTTSEAALIAALAPFGLTSQDEDGHPVLLTASHDHALAYAGRVQSTPAEFNNDGNVITEATYLPGEYAVLRGDEALVKQIMAATLDGVEVLAEPPAGCPTFGEWKPLPAVDEQALLAAAKTSACNAIDAEAEHRRNAVLTPGAGQMSTYQEKERQAKGLLNDPSPTEEEYPDIFNEIGITADSAADVAMTILAAAEKWRAYGRQVEKTRLRTKRLINESDSIKGVLEIQKSTIWP